MKAPAGSYVTGFDVDETTHTGESHPSFVGKIRLKTHKLTDLAKLVTR